MALQAPLVRQENIFCYPYVELQASGWQVLMPIWCGPLMLASLSDTPVSLVSQDGQDAASNGRTSGYITRRF